jgi:hypothetical protein
MGLQDHYKEITQVYPISIGIWMRSGSASEFITPSLFIVQATKMTDDESIAARIEELMELEEARFLADFHQTMEKDRQKAWHDRHIKHKSFAQGDQVLLYDRQVSKHPGKLQMHWLGPFIVAEIHESGVVRLTQLDGILHPGWVNGTPEALHFCSISAIVQCSCTWECIQ